MPKCPELSVLVKILAGERYNKDVEMLSLNKLNLFWYFYLKHQITNSITFNFEFWLNLF